MPVSFYPPPSGIMRGPRADRPAVAPVGTSYYLSDGPFMHLYTETGWVVYGITAPMLENDPALFTDFGTGVTPYAHNGQFYINKEFSTPADVGKMIGWETVVPVGAIDFAWWARIDASGLYNTDHVSGGIAFRSASTSMFSALMFRANLRGLDVLFKTSDPSAVYAPSYSWPCENRPRWLSISVQKDAGAGICGVQYWISEHGSYFQQIYAEGHPLATFNPTHVGFYIWGRASGFDQTGMVAMQGSTFGVYI